MADYSKLEDFDEYSSHANSPFDFDEYFETVIALKPEVQSMSTREIEFRDETPQPFEVQISLAEYFQRIKRHKIDPWQIHLCDALQDAVVNRHLKRWWAVIHAEGQLGKPLWVNTLVQMHDGTYKKLGEIKVGDHVITYTGTAQKVEKVFEQGELPVLKITTHCGREIISAYDHPFLTPEGWVNAENLKVGQVLASVRQAQTHSVTYRTDNEFEMLGYFIGDGCVTSTKTGSIQAGITSGDREQSERILSLAANFGWEWRESKKPGAKCKTYNFKSGVRDWIRESGIAGCDSFTKRVPEWVFQGSNHQVALFVGAYFSCDGSIGKSGKDGRNKVCDFYSVSKGLLEDIQRLLLRIGIQSYLREKKGRYQDRSHLSYRLYFCSQDYNAIFARTVPVAGKKGKILAEINPFSKTFPQKYLPDPIVAIETIGTAHCKCLQVANDHTFTANDIIVHNTSIISQAFPAWIFGHLPSFRFALAMYNVTQSKKHSRVVINIMTSNTHKDIFTNKDGHIFSDEGAMFGRKISIEGWMTNARREVNDGQWSFNPVGLQSGLTGSGFDWLSIDDPYKEAKEAFSPVINEKLRDFFNFTVRSRVGAHSCVSGMFHRYAPEDLGGFLLDTGEFEYLRYATCFDGPYIHEKTGRRYDDPIGRKKGDYISPRKKPEDYDHVRKNNRVWLSMFQGRPSSEEGDFFNVGKIIMISEKEAIERQKECLLITRSYDLASSTEENAAYSVGVKMGIRATGRITIFEMWRERVDTATRTKRQKQNALRDGPNVKIVLPIDPGAAGASTVFFIQQMLKEYTVVGRETSGSKEERALNFSIAVNDGLVEMVECPEDANGDSWNKDLKRELRDFPLSEYKDICFVAGTMIQTIDGEKPIEAIKIGDLILTRAGYKPVIKAGLTQENATVKIIYFSNGNTLTGTPNHPIFVQGKGFIAIDTLTDGDIIQTWQNQKQLFSTGSPFVAIPKVKIQLIADIFTEWLGKGCWDCIRQFGSSITGLSQKVFISTIKMKTISITTFPIWNQFHPNSIMLSIGNLGRNNHLRQKILPVWNALDLLQFNGINRKKGEHGIVNTRKHQLLIAHLKNSIVLSAEKNLWQFHLALNQTQDDFAIITVPQSIVAEKSVNLLKNNVLFAVSNIWETSEYSPAPVSVVRVEDGKERKPVYNLSVAEKPEYYANGVLVHNCDASSDGYNELWETWTRGVVVRNYKWQRNFIKVSEFMQKFSAKSTELTVSDTVSPAEFRLPAKFAVYAAVKINQDASKPTSAIIVARAPAYTDCGEALFVLDEYKRYDANMYAMFDWLKERLEKWKTSSEPSIWIHPDSDQYRQTIASKLPFCVGSFKEDDLAGHNEMNWYMMGTEKEHPFGRKAESATNLYFVCEDEFYYGPDYENENAPQSFYHARQEMQTWGFDKDGNPTAVGHVIDCLRIICHRFRTYAESYTMEEEVSITMNKYFPYDLDQIREEGTMTHELQQRLFGAKMLAKLDLEEKYGKDFLKKQGMPEDLWFLEE